MCENLHTFYDGRVLKFLPKNLRALFEKKAREEYIKKRDRPTVLNLAYNFFAKIPPSPSYITGPFSLTRHRSREHGKEIYVFGESHGYKKTCGVYRKPPDETMRINNFLAEVFSTSAVFIDFYVEYPAYKSIEYSLDPKNIKADIILRDVFEEVHGCLYPNPPKCKWNTMRAHFTDIRVFESEEVPASFLLRLHNMPFEYWTLSETDASRLNIINKRYDEPDAFINFIFEEVAAAPLLRKEMERSTLHMNRFGEILYNFLTDKSARIFYPTKRVPFKAGDNFRPRNFDSNSIGAQNILMDFYQLARIFKKFKVGPGDNQPAEPHYVISYSGENHSIFLRSALKTLGFEWLKTSRPAPADGQCADVRGIVPLFPNF